MTDKPTQISSAFGFINALGNENAVNFHELLLLLAKFKEIYDEEKAGLPYHINLIDELHIDENAHSRVFAKLLRYQKHGEYPFLEKFLTGVCKFEITVQKPEVKKVDSCGRIDIPIFDIGYAIVIENKVTDKASDQNGSEGGQLARYIETINKDYRRNLDDIYVVYTPKYTREPSDDCWENKNGISYKDEFKRRFRSLSYRDGIYPWLKDEILPLIDSKDSYLRSAVEQYLDYLEGVFSLRSINKKMNMRLQEFIKKEFSLPDDNLEEAIEILSEKEKELNDAISQIQLLKSEYKKQNALNHFREWRKSLQSDFPDFEVVGDEFTLDKVIINVGVKFTVDGLDFAAIIEYNLKTDKIYFGIGRHHVGDVKHIASESLQQLLDKHELKAPEDYWYGWKYTSFERGYRVRLKALIEDL